MNEAETDEILNALARGNELFNVFRLKESKGKEAYDYLERLFNGFDCTNIQIRKSVFELVGWAKEQEELNAYRTRGQVVTRKTLKGRKQLGEYQIGWKIKTGNVLDFYNQRSTQQYTKSGVTKHLGVAGLQQQNGLVEETNVTLLAKWVIKLWRLHDVTSKVVLYRNMGFNESGEYKKTFIGSGVGTGSVQVLQGVKFEVKPQEDHTFEVEPHGNVDHVAGSQEVQTQNLIYYHLAHDREQHSTHELFSYREDSNEAAFAVAEAEKIYAHESLTFNNTVACEVISKWRAGLKGDMDARSDMYVLSNGCKKCSDDSDGYYWEYTPDRQESEWDCDVEKNDVGMLDKFDRGLQIDVQVFVDFDYAMAAYMTLTKAAKEDIWLKGLAIESGSELKIVAGIATGALSKAIPGPRFSQQLLTQGLKFGGPKMLLGCSLKRHDQGLNKLSFAQSRVGNVTSKRTLYSSKIQVKHVSNVLYCLCVVTFKIPLFKASTVKLLLEDFILLNDNDGGSNSGSAFIGGFVLGGVLVGTLGAIFAPQALAGTDKKELLKKLPNFIYDEEKALEVQILSHTVRS
ncbi:zinc finger, CCHC-type containing protein [Tanacetum coccineum]